jgi:hypothetical protein
MTARTHDPKAPAGGEDFRPLNEMLSVWGQRSVQARFDIGGRSLHVSNWPPG